MHRLRVRPLLLKLGQPQNEQSQPLCSSRRRCEARSLPKLKLMAFLIGAHVCQSDGVPPTPTTSAHLPALIGHRPRSEWMMSYMITGAGGRLIHRTEQPGLADQLGGWGKETAKLLFDNSFE